MSIKKKTSSICPICGKKYIGETVLKNHLLKAHEKDLHGLSPANVLFNLRNKKSGSNCIICKKPVTFNEITGKYNRLCENPKCKEAYVKLFKERMKKVYGKEHLLNDAKQQEKMLAGRHISGKLKFADGKEFIYTGSYEKDFLEFMQNMEWKSNDLIMPAPFEIAYKYEGKNHFYIPDAYIPSLDLIIEIKGENNHYQARDISIRDIKMLLTLISVHNLKRSWKNKVITFPF